jgi:hypothetical protein
MNKVEAYIEQLNSMNDWDEFLLSESGLPGPRSNLELIQAVAQTGSEDTFLRYLTYKKDMAPTNSKEEFLAACGTVGLGKLIVDGEKGYLSTLRNLASDSRWRIRESVAMALQIYGESNMDELINSMAEWSLGSCLEKRAVAAALCEPKLLLNKEQAVKVLKILHNITEAISEIKDRKDEGFVVLKKGMGYCWSVAIVAAPEVGRKLFEQWINNEDKDIRWILKENLKKNRLTKMDESWVIECRKIFELK